MKFQPGNCANPGGKPKQKPMSDALRYIAKQPFKEGKRIGLPKNPTVEQAAARALWRKAIMGDVPAFKEIADRIQGKVPQAVVGGGIDEPPIQTEDISMKETARIIASLLLSQRDEPDE